MPPYNYFCPLKGQICKRGAAAGRAAPISAAATAVVSAPVTATSAALRGAIIQAAAKARAQADTPAEYAQKDGGPAHDAAFGAGLAPHPAAGAVAGALVHSLIIAHKLFL